MGARSHTLDRSSLQSLKQDVQNAETRDMNPTELMTGVKGQNMNIASRGRAG